MTWRSWTAPTPWSSRRGFFKRRSTPILKILTPGGIFTELTESPFADAALMRQAIREMRKVFPIVKMYWGAVPTYPSGMWTYGAASLAPDPASPLREIQGTRYYTGEIHKAAFVLPPFLEALIQPGPHEKS